MTVSDPLVSAAASSSRPDSDLERLAARTSLSAEDKIAELARRFEGLLLRNILKSMHRPVFETEGLSAGLGKGVYGDLALEHLANAVSRADQVGFGQSLRRQLIEAESPSSPLSSTPSTANLESTE